MVAHLQIARGAVGQCVQKVGEAEVLAWGGVPDILVSNEVVGAAKLARLAALARIGKVAVCADDAAQLAPIGRRRRQAGVRMPVLVEIDVGGGRCGVQPGPEAVALAQADRRLAAPRLRRPAGLSGPRPASAHAGGAAATRSRRRATARAARVEQLRQQGLDCPIVGGAGTGTFELEAASGVYTEIQAGSYCFMDADYARNLDEAGDRSPRFRHALFVLATVISAPRPGLAVLDVGHKGVAVDCGPPLVWQRPDLRHAGCSDEHGNIDVASETTPPKLGEKLRLVPGHCDPTVDRYDWYVGVRGGRVECLWPVAARGAMH